MGTCLHAIVEVAQPRYSYTGEKITEVPGEVHWWQLATLEFNKDYQLMSALHRNDKVVDYSWPDDICSEITEDPELEVEDLEVKQWCTVENYISLIVNRDDEGKTFSATAEALKAFLEIIGTQKWVRGLRILFYRT